MAYGAGIQQLFGKVKKFTQFPQTRTACNQRRSPVFSDACNYCIVRITKLDPDLWGGGKYSFGRKIPPKDAWNKLQ